MWGCHVTFVVARGRYKFLCRVLGRGLAIVALVVTTIESTIVTTGEI